MDENNPKQRKGLSLSFIASFLIVVGLIFAMVYFFFFNNKSTTLSTEKFVAYANEGYVSEVTSVTPKEETVVSLSGKYYPVKGQKTKASFTVVISFTQFYSEETTYYYDKSTFNAISADQYNEGSSENYVKLENVIISQLLIDKGYTFSTTDPYVTTFWEEWGPTIITSGITLLIFALLFTRLSGSIGGSNAKALDFNKSRARRVNTSHIKFDDVAGCDAEKLEMSELVSYLKEPTKYSKLGAKLPKGVLLMGPPGCGKTLLAKAVAGEAGVPFYSISGSDFVEMFVGVGAGRVRDMFKIAKENAPCLIFIDEIDAVGRQRGAGLGGGNDEREQTLNQLLVEMDGFTENSGIIVIAATNRDDVLDPALLRAGRFDRKITVSLPDKAGREAIFKVHSRNKLVDPSVDFSLLAKRTVGFSGADIENIMNEAAILSVRENKDIITIKEIDEAIDRRLSGPAKSNKAFSEKDKRNTAYHEAGHAIIGLTLENADKVRKITIIPRGEALGYVMMTPENDKISYTKSELLAEICGLLGGRSSEEVFFQDVTTGASNDIERATRIARLMVTEWGMSSLGPIQYEKADGNVFLGRDYSNTQKNFSASVAQEIDKEIRKIIEDAHQQAIKIINDRKDDVILIAETLLERETITEEEIKYLLEHRKMPDDKPSTNN